MNSDCLLCDRGDKPNNAGAHTKEPNEQIVCWCGNRCVCGIRGTATHIVHVSMHPDSHDFTPECTQAARYDG